MSSEIFRVSTTKELHTCPLSSNFDSTGDSVTCIFSTITIFSLMKTEKVNLSLTLIQQKKRTLERKSKSEAGRKQAEL